jgi:PAS domain S-box-containing protein
MTDPTTSAREPLPKPTGVRSAIAAGSGRALIAPVLLLVVLGAMTVFLAINQLVTARESRAWVTHSRNVIETAQSLFMRVQDVESGTRGYLLSGGDPGLLDAYDTGRAEIPQLEAKLRTLASDNPAQVARVDRLNAMIDQRVAVSVRRVELYRSGRKAEATASGNRPGKAAMDGVRAAMADIMTAETALLEQRTRHAGEVEALSFVVGLTASALALIGLAALIVSMGLANRRLAHAMRELQAAEAAQRESEARYRAIFANTADMLSVIEVGGDGQFRMTEVNPAYERATGSSTLQLRGVDLRWMAPEPQAGELISHLKNVVSGGKPIFTRDRVAMPGGQRIWESILVPVRNAKGVIDRILASSRDVTERENAQDQLRRAQRMEAVGHLTGGVAHDFNNLLQVIRGNLELLATMVEENESASARVKNALHGANRAAQLTRQLLAFARRQPLEPKVVSLGRLVSDMAEMLRRTLGESIEVETVIAGGLWNTLADAAQVESAVLNLAINARDAMPEGGRLTVEVTNAVLDDAYAKREAEIEPGQYVLLAVSDTGQGMDAATLSRVFEPFFTTKGEEKGTGLGLSMVYGFVKQSNGHVQIYSEPGQGTTVKIYLPRSKEREVFEAPVTGSLLGRSEVILVVEDDDMVRASAVGMLRDLGYTCIHASDGDSALAIIKQDAKIDLLFTDVIMPGTVKSRELANEAHRLRPGLPVLFTSGYTDNAIVHHGRLDEGVQLLSKPYSRDDLARKIRGLLKDNRRVVLVVEDDALVRMSAVDMTEALGFTPLEAADAPSALKILDSDARVDVLFTDIGLPGMRGHELAAKARDLRPGLKIVFASGYGETEEGQTIADATHLGKPYEQDQLAEALGPAG